MSLLPMRALPAPKPTQQANKTPKSSKKDFGTTKLSSSGMKFTALTCTPSIVRERHVWNTLFERSQIANLIVGDAVTTVAFLPLLQKANAVGHMNASVITITSMSGLIRHAQGHFAYSTPSMFRSNKMIAG